MLAVKNQEGAGCNGKAAFTWALQESSSILWEARQVSELRKQRSSNCGGGTDTQKNGSPKKFFKEACMNLLRAYVT